MAKGLTEPHLRGPVFSLFQLRGVQLPAPFSLLSTTFNLGLQGSTRTCTYSVPWTPAFKYSLDVHLHQPHSRCANKYACVHPGPWGLCFKYPWWLLHWGLMQPTRPGAGLRWRASGGERAQPGCEVSWKRFHFRQEGGGGEDEGIKEGGKQEKRKGREGTRKERRVNRQTGPSQ